MTVLQQYYTSFVNKQTGTAGFQVKAMSPGITPETQAMISRLIAYRIPTDMDVRAVEQHPVALRYYYRTPQECMLLCSQSNGNDENGRPGNFFAHTVVMPPDTLTSQPPILYWHSSFWRKHAPEETLIRPVSVFQAQQSPTILDEMWNFLADEGRAETFYKLMCAVVQSEKTNRRIVIIDTDKHVALWLAAVSCMLPPAYRPFLSFATYHHDPYQSWFLITGTDDSSFRSLPEENMSHFVLDGRTNRTSDVAESNYAKLIRAYMKQKLYNKFLLAHFLLHEKRFPAPTHIDEQLDALALYVWLRDQKGAVSVGSGMLAAINTVLASFEQMSSYDDEDRQELALLMSVLENARTNARSAEVHETYDRVVHLYQKHNIAVDEILRKDLQYSTKLLLENPSQAALADANKRLDLLRKHYEEPMFVAFLNRPEYLNYVTQLLKNSSHWQLQRIWATLGSFLQPNDYTHYLFLTTVRVWGELEQTKQTVDAKALLSVLKGAIDQHELTWLQLLIGHDATLSEKTLERFYWQFARPLSLKQREPYRVIVQRSIPTIATIEFGFDMTVASGSQGKVEALNRWLAYTAQNPIRQPSAVLDEGLKYVEPQCTTEQWHMLIADLLMDASTAPLLVNREDAFLHTLFADVSLQQFDAKYVTLYKKYKDHPTLSAGSQSILSGMVAMTDSYLDIPTERQLRAYVHTLPTEMYFREVQRFLTEFLKGDITEEMHMRMLSALFVWVHATHFWSSYWENVSVMLTSLLTNDLEKAIRLLSFWFALSPKTFSQPDHAYIVQQFFLGLRTQLLAAQKLPDFPQALENMNMKAHTFTWYPLLQDVLIVKKKDIIAAGQQWMKRIQKRLPGQKVDEEELAQERQVQGRIEQLLEKGKIREQHQRNFLLLSLDIPHEQFFLLYRNMLARVLTSKDVEYVHEVFSFWCDESFDRLGQEPYLAQEFFIKLPQVFEWARKEREEDFRKTAQLIATRYKRAAQQEQPFRWYSLLHPLFVSQ